MENASEDEDVRNQDGKTGYCDINSHDYQNYDLIDIGAGARELEKRKNVTQVMVDDIDMAEGKSKHAPCVGRGSSKSHHICSSS